MEISPPMTLTSFLESIAAKVNIIAHKEKPISRDAPSSPKAPLEIDDTHPITRPRLLLDPLGDPFPKELESPPIFLVGPEGGFTQEEKEAILAKDFIPVSLGPYVLRAETASLAALAAYVAQGG
jgi:16S rRNA (uracil1498-N3)-methyltransferase